jgi:uncharacterized protein with HEPN domain
MPRERSDDVYLADMLRFAREASEFVSGRTWDEFLSDLLFRRAVERSVSLVGEAAKKVSTEFEEAHPEIPWNRIIVQRHRIVHEYDLIDESIIWSVATVHVPVLIEQLERLLPPPPQDPEGD